MATDLRSGLIEAGRLLGVSPVDIGTVVGFETGGTFNPWQRGPTTKWGTHRGLIQFGEPQAAKYGAFAGQSAYDQLTGPVVSYLRDAGVKPGMGLLDVYSAVNAGRVGRYNASDAAAGGTPGTVADKVANQMGGHRDRAAAILGGDYTPAASTVPPDRQAQGMPASAPPTAPGAPQPEPASDYAEVAAILQRLTKPQGQPQQAPVYDLAAEPSALAGMMDEPRPAPVFDASRFYALLGRR